MPILNQIASIRGKIIHRAAQVGLFYVVCFWKSPIDENICHRVGYFEEVIEAEEFAKMLCKTYTNFGYPYYIDCSIAFAGAADGGLLDEED